MLYREIIAVCSEIHTKHINTLCGQNVELLNVKRGGALCNHWAVYRVNGSSVYAPGAGGEVACAVMLTVVFTTIFKHGLCR
jgi:hypothetical protein